nr:hypothetical protein L203_05493 [Cryptococcus depauperatus CBS 7841]
MSFQPFSPWMSPSELKVSPSTSHENPSYFSNWKATLECKNANSRPVTTPKFSDKDEGVLTTQSEMTYWKQRSQSGDVGNVNAGSSKFSGPFLPGLDIGPWSPPLAGQWRSRQQSSPSQHELEESLLQANVRIRQLTLENRRLQEYIASLALFEISFAVIVNVYMQIGNTLIPQLTMPDVLTPSSEVKSSFSSSTGPDFQDLSKATSTSIKDKSQYTAPQFIIQSVLQGSFNFATMPPQLIRAIVWTLAYCQPKNNHESAGLKTAVKALTARFGVSDGSEPSLLLVQSIIEWAKPLCYTSCGNYLCQQLLERGNVPDKQVFLKQIHDEIVPIASNKFGTHVLCKAINLKELEEPVSEALFQYGVYESMQTGGRRLWREYLEKCRQSKSFEVFERVNKEMEYRWADLACVNEHGSISVQQVFEVFGSQELMMPCFDEILRNIAHISNNQFGHFVVTKLISYPALYKTTCEAILTSYPPVATTHHGVNLAKIALNEGGRSSFVKYLDAICRYDDGRTPGIVTIATSSIGKAHLTFLMSCLTAPEHTRLRSTCRAYSTTLRNCQSGNDLLRTL